MTITSVPTLSSMPLSTVGKQLAWITAGVIAWFGVNMVFPKVAGLLLAAVVIFALVQIGPELAKI